MKNSIIAIIVILVATLTVACNDEQVCTSEDCRESICNDGIDNDEDGKTDCEDSDCNSAPECQSSNNTNNVTTEEICDDGKDNDNDGDTDCADSDCSSKPECQSSNNTNNVTTESNCTDKIDNDGDGNVDCEDSDCVNLEICTESICDDNIDNDGDGQTDCLDPDCANVGNCPNINAELYCDDGIDNNGDGYTDCRDHTCHGAMACTGLPRYSDFLVVIPGQGTTGGAIIANKSGQKWRHTSTNQDFQDAKTTCESGGSCALYERFRTGGTAAGSVVTGNYEGDTGGDGGHLWLTAYTSGLGCSVAALRPYGIHYQNVLVAVVNASGKRYKVEGHAHCGDEWDDAGVHAQNNVAFFLLDLDDEPSRRELFNSFDTNTDHRDETFAIDMGQVTYYQPKGF